MKLLLTKLTNLLNLENAKERQNRNYSALVKIANQIIYALLSTDTLLKKEKRTLYLLIEMMEDCGFIIPGRDLSIQNKLRDNTPDYKIARELIIKFKNNDFHFLKAAVNYYYYDSLLVNTAIDQMIALDPIAGLCAGLSFAQAKSRESKEQMKVRYFTQLKEYADDPKFTFKVARSICGNSSMPFEVEKQMGILILKKNLLKQADSENAKWYKGYIKKILLPSKTKAGFKLRMKRYHARLNAFATARKVNPSLPVPDFFK